MSWKGHEPPRSHQSAPSGGGTKHQTRARVGDQAKQIQAVLRRSEGLARLYEPQNNTPCDQTTPKAIWTLHSDQENFPCRLPSGPAAQLEDTQCLPRVTSIPISRNAGTWPEFHRTPTSPYRRRTRMGSRTHCCNEAVWAQQEAPVSRKMEGLLRGP